MNHTDTIAAAATAMGSAGIGIIRISGTDAFAVLEKVFRPKNEKKVMSEQPGYTVHYGMAVDGEQVLDEVLVMLMRGPHSYTAEDTAEIDCHGGRLVMQKILEYGNKLNFAYSSTIAWLYFLIIAVLLALVFLLFGRRVVYAD